MALQYLSIVRYNNYFNRIIKKESTANLYREGRPSASFSNFNFNPNDGITTSITVGAGGVNSLDQMDYVVVHDINDNISSR